MSYFISILKLMFTSKTYENNNKSKKKNFGHSFNQFAVKYFLILNFGKQIKYNSFPINLLYNIMNHSLG